MRKAKALLEALADRFPSDKPAWHSLTVDGGRLQITWFHQDATMYPVKLEDHELDLTVDEVVDKITGILRDSHGLNIE